MIIKKNEEVAKKFLEQFGNFEIELDELEKKYVNQLIEMHKTLEKEMWSSEKYHQEFDNRSRRRFEEIESIKKKYEPMRTLIDTFLQNCSQNMLVHLIRITSNKSLIELISNQIRKNNSVIINFNNVYMESGLIFELLKGMPEEEKYYYLNLIEDDEELVCWLNGREEKLSKLNFKTKELIEKSFYDDLEHEKEMYCIEHNLSDEQEFQFHKKAILNGARMKNAIETQTLLNKFVGVQDNTLVNNMFDSLDKSTIIMPGKKI